MSVELTKNAKSILKIFYQEYQKQHTADPSKDTIYFGDPETIQQSLCPDWNINDIIAACRELKRKGMLQWHIGDDSFTQSNFTPQGIEYMECEESKSYWIKAHWKGILEVLGLILGIIVSGIVIYSTIVG